MDIDNKYGTLSAQKGLLELLKVFHSFCLQNGIHYSLAYGSLLGAIRHNGFIPWDDDLDVFVDRKNYKLLVEKIRNSQDLMVDNNSINSLWVDRVRMKKDIHYGSYEPTIDILLLDNVPVKPLKRRLKLLSVLFLQGMIKPDTDLHKGSFVLKVCTLVTFVLGRLFPLQLKKKWYRKVIQIGDLNLSELVANYNGEYSDLKRSYPSDMMEHIIEHDFEDTKAFIVEDYDMCLTTQFGDYMTPPKESERTARHGGGN